MLQHALCSLPAASAPQRRGGASGIGAPRQPSEGVSVGKGRKGHKEMHAGGFKEDNANDGWWLVQVWFVRLWWSACCVMECTSVHRRFTPPKSQPAGEVNFGLPATATRNRTEVTCTFFWRLAWRARALGIERTRSTIVLSRDRALQSAQSWHLGAPPSTCAHVYVLAFLVLGPKMRRKRRRRRKKKRLCLKKVRTANWLVR